MRTYVHMSVRMYVAVSDWNMNSYLDNFSLAGFARGMARADRCCIRTSLRTALDGVHFVIPYFLHTSHDNDAKQSELCTSHFH